MRPLQRRVSPMNENVTKKELLVFGSIVVLMLGSLVYGFFFAGAGQPDNCWAKYSTEQAAIEHCEVHK